MFCSNIKELEKVDHFIAKIISDGSFSIKKDGVELETNCDRGESFIIYGGFNPGSYLIESSGHTMLYIYKDGKTIKEAVVEHTIILNIDRYECKVYGL